MLEEEVIALVTRIGQPEHVTQAKEILARYSSQSRQESLLTHPLDAQPAVSLEPLASEHTFFTVPHTPASPSEPTAPAGTAATHLETLDPEPQSAEASSASEGHDSRRYEILGLLGRGGMGEVRRILDRELGRTLAMKVASPRVMNRPASLARFVEEAQVSAQLQHPGIIPVHELGSLPDGRLYFTMQEVRGRTLSAVIAEVHAASSSDRWEAATSGWTFRRLVDAFLRACEAVAYAHERGVVHRDLKPENIMVGEHGEVLVLDWGIAKVNGRPDFAAEQGELDAIQTERSRDGTHATRMGSVAGTPAYMPPEQAMGQVDCIDGRSDIYSLGAILYELLSGRVPYVGTTSVQVLDMVRNGPPEPVEKRGLGERSVTGPPGPPLPEELVAACHHAMERAQEDRFQSASELASVIRNWLDGAKRREKALAVVEEAKTNGPRAQALLRQARELRAEAETLLEGIQSWEPEEKKAPGWAKQDEAGELERQAALAELEEVRGLQGALRVDPALAEAHAALAERLLQDHQAAEAARKRDDALRAESGLQLHVSSLPEGDEVRNRCVAYLEGYGALTLHTEPVGSDVLLYRYVKRNRRLVPTFERSLGKAPIRSLTLPMGSYLCVLKHPECEEVRYPVNIGRQEHWDGVPPGDDAAMPIVLPRKGTLGSDECYVPAGWFWSGGDPDALQALPRRRIWSDAFVFKRFPVTNRQYIAFLDDLVATGREEEALQFAPREKSGTIGESGAMIYGRDERGRFVLRPDADGDVWEPEWPVMMVDWPSAAAYCRWFATQTGEAWRLPGELEWSKAARGVDGRLYPWGDDFDSSWCCMQDSHKGHRLPAFVDAFPIDESPYGVRGMAGNMRAWCADLFCTDGPPTPGRRVEVARVPPHSTSEQGTHGDSRSSPPSHAVFVIRGGSWNSSKRSARVAGRGRGGAPARSDILGFRLVRSVPGDTVDPE